MSLAYCELCKTVRVADDREVGLIQENQDRDVQYQLRMWCAICHLPQLFVLLYHVQYGHELGMPTEKTVFLKEE